MQKSLVLIASDDHVGSRNLERIIVSFGYQTTTIPRKHMTFSSVQNYQPALLIIDLDHKDLSLCETISWQENLCLQFYHVLTMSSRPSPAALSSFNLEHLQKPFEVDHIETYLARLKYFKNNSHTINSSNQCMNFLDDVQSFIQDKCGLDLNWRRLNSLERAIKQRMEALRIIEQADYLQLLKTISSTTNELANLIDVLTVGETCFFRYAAQDLTLVEQVLPEIIQRKSRERSINIWSAGCATGEEPYSLALLILKHFPELQKWDIRIFATDINQRFLASARAGCYSERTMRNVPHEQRDEYFIHKNNKFILSEAVRKLVNFEYCNLHAGPFPSQKAYPDGFDIILCRNVLIYFDDISKKMTLDRLIDTLNPQGFLFFGHTEFMQNFSRRLKLLQNGQSFYYRVKQADDSITVGTVASTCCKSSDPVPGVDLYPPVLKLTRKEAPCEPKPVEAPGEFDCLAVYLDAVSAFDRGEFSHAIEQYDAILKNAAEHVGALVGKGFIASLQGNYEEGWAFSCRAIMKDDLYPDAYLLRGLIHEKQGNLEDAIRELQKALWLEQELVAAHYLLSRVLAQLDRLQDAQRYLKNTLKLLRNKKDARYFGGLSPQGLANCHRLLSQPNQFNAA